MPATPAFPDSILTKIRAGHQATRFRAVLGAVYQFRAYCCDINSNSIMGVSKQPVIHLELTPNPVCLGDAVHFDFAGSYAPGSAITDYSIDMGDFTEYNVASGDHTYLAAGTYNITARISEPLGKYQTAEAQVIVIDCDVPLLIAYTYISTLATGVYFIDWKATVPSWEARSTGLDGLGLHVNSLAMNPATKHLPDTVHELWAATEGGLYRTFNGGRSWAKLTLPDPDNTDFADVPPAAVSELSWLCVKFSPIDQDTVYAMAAKIAPARLWMYRTDNTGISWASKGVL